MVGFPSDYGYVPVRIRNSSYWYHSPLHQNATPSFKVDTVKNTWYDFGIGIGGNLVDFVCMFRQVDIRCALEIIAEKNQNVAVGFIRQKSQQNTADSNLIILEENPVISNRVIKQYLSDRGILPIVYGQYCSQIRYCIKENHFTAIGFKNKMGGYEIRSPRFKGSSSPKFISWYDNGSKIVQVFEGFFDCLRALVQAMEFSPGLQLL